MLEQLHCGMLPLMLTPSGLMNMLCLAALGWIILLRRRLQQQTGLILERLQREVALEERYRDLFESASDMVYTHDLAGNLTSLNRAGERITG
jgi:PAS domain-containing protein